jgi:hypothetical protein
MTRKDVAWWVGVFVVLAELTAIAAYPDEAVVIVRNVYLTCWKYLPVPEGVDPPTYHAER